MDSLRNVRHFFGALYAWWIALFLGTVVLDLVYSRLLVSAVGTLAVASVYREVSDVLLLLGAFAALAGLIAVGVTWRVPSARALFALSLLAVGSEFVVPLILGPIFTGSPEAAPFGIGPLVRFLPIGIASLLAFLGFRSTVLGPPLSGDTGPGEAAGPVSGQHAVDNRK
jgi:hypothetical protein